MKQIRIWRMRVISLTLAESWGGSEWVDATPENQTNYAALLEAALRKFGKGTHWMEERTVLPVRDTATVPPPSSSTETG